MLGLHTATSTAPCVIEPKNLRRALTGPHSKEWRKAMDAEIRALESRDTRVPVDRAAIKGRRILSGKWVFRVKTAADGTIKQFMARWVVRGYDQRYGIDFDQTFAPVSCHTSVRILLAIAAARHLPLRQIDVKNAFLYTLVDTVIYVEQPHTYGEGDSRLPHDPGVYRRDFCGEYILLTVYVDDLLYTGSSNELLEEFEKNLAGRVDITCNHNVKQILGLNISYSPEAIHLLAAKYAEELGKRFNITPAPLSTPCRTPGPNHKPDNKAMSPTGIQTYQQQLRCLLFASVTCRPDLLYIASQLAHYSRKPTAENPSELVALSSTEAEFIAATAAVREGLYLQELLQEAKIPSSPTFCLHCDNQSAIRIANKPGFGNRTKHIALRYFFVKNEVDKGKVDLTYWPTSDIAADFLTKRLSRQQYQHCS
ncbi:unnamed protein product [Closterium sp. NIES-53]